MKQFLLTFCIGWVVTAGAQITVTQSDFPAGGDTALISVSDALILDLVTTGANETWDFSNLHISEQRVDTFYNLSTASFLYQAQFNNGFTEPEYLSDYYTSLVGFDLGGVGGMGVTIERPVGFVKIGSTKYENVGMGMKLNGYEVPMAMDSIDIEFELPLNYSDSWADYSYINVDMNPAFNAIFIRHQNRNSIVDGWGQITTKFGTFDVLRVKSLVTVTDSVNIDLGFGSTWFELPTPDQIEYTWISNGNKVPILKVVTQDIAGTETPTRVEFKDQQRNLVGIEENTISAEHIYPNPSNGTVNINVGQNNSSLMIYSISGAIVYENQNAIGLVTLDASMWSKGAYIVKIINENNVATSKLILD